MDRFVADVAQAVLDPQGYIHQTAAIRREFCDDIVYGIAAVWSHFSSYSKEKCSKVRFKCRRQRALEAHEYSFQQYRTRMTPTPQHGGIGVTV
jgi:hypothetical protein